MKKRQKSATQIELKKATRKILIKRIVPTAICFYVGIFVILIYAGILTHRGAIGWLRSQGSSGIAFIICSIAIIPLMWFVEKPYAREEAKKNITKDIIESFED